MLNALATLPFLLAVAVAGMALLETIGGNWHKVMAALQGRSLLAEGSLTTRPVKVHYTARPAVVRSSVRPAAEWRVAA